MERTVNAPMWLPSTWQDKLPDSKIVGWNESWVVWQWKIGRFVPFPDKPYNAHPVAKSKITGSGTYDLTAAEATELTGIPL